MVNRHVRDAELPVLRKQLAERDKCRKEVRACKRHAAFFEKLLRGQRQGGRDACPEWDPLFSDRNQDAPEDSQRSGFLREVAPRDAPPVP